MAKSLGNELTEDEMWKTDPCMKKYGCRSISMYS